MGAAATMETHPIGALTIGLIAGFVSSVGFAFLQPILADKWSLFDTCGVNNLHGMPGILGGLFSAIFACFMTLDECKLLQYRITWY